VIDSHCHYDSDQFDQDREAAIARARAAGVKQFLAIGTGEGPPHLDGALQLALAHPDFLATVGVHPHHALRVRPETYPALDTLLRHPKVVGFGEIGLDYYYDFSPRDVQQEVFARQLELARLAGLPIVIHTRDAWDDTLAMLSENWDFNLGGIFHCFTGDTHQATQALDLNFHLGLGGVLTFPRAQALRDAASFTPLDRLLLETDAPYLAPVPYRGKRNESAFLPETAKRLAALRGLFYEEICALTTQNFHRLFSAKLEQPA
jgi:TatD DNase family protein